MKCISGLERLYNFAGVTGVIVVLCMAFTLQIIIHELPCPLCLLQRLGLICVALGFLLNLRYGLRVSHYSLIILSALFTNLVALRQIALHIVPGTGFYGNAFLGLHLYTWSFIFSMIIIVMTTLMLSMNRQYSTVDLQISQFRTLTSILFFALLILIAINIVTVFLECGLTLCPPNPTQYFFLSLSNYFIKSG